MSLCSCVKLQFHKCGWMLTVKLRNVAVNAENGSRFLQHTTERPASQVTYTLDPVCAASVLFLDGLSVTSLISGAKDLPRTVAGATISVHHSSGLCCFFFVVVLFYFLVRLDWIGSFHNFHFVNLLPKY